MAGSGRARFDLALRSSAFRNSHHREQKKYVELKEELRETYPYAPVPDDIWNRVEAIQDELASHSEHQGLSIADLVIAATAIRLNLTVLHYDADFETVSRRVSHLKQQRISVNA
jgi:predicted nucleic acid-binding protein